MEEAAKEEESMEETEAKTVTTSRRKVCRPVGQEQVEEAQHGRIPIVAKKYVIVMPAG
jgi:hypothetical protein